MSQGERDAHVRILLEDVLNVQPLAPADQRFSEGELVSLKKAVLKILSGIPVQYVTGKVEFYGLMLQVAPGVLIPRPETEELVEHTVSGMQGHETVVDLCSGSGCIALAVKKQHPDARVIGVEKSNNAVEQSIRNGEDNGLKVEWRCLDVFDDGCCVDLKGQVDRLVSNPPYIPFSEKQEMDSRVVDHEPAEALFVEDDDPMVFYRRIAVLGRQLLKESGKLICEVHENHADQVVHLFSENQYRHVLKIQDMQGKDRMVCADI